MSLTDIMSHADLTLYPEIGLGVFLAIFAVVALRTVFASPSQRNEWDESRRMPLQGEESKENRT